MGDMHAQNARTNSAENATFLYMTSFIAAQDAAGEHLQK